MQTDLKFIRKESQDKFDENQYFFNFLKKFAGEIISPHIKDISAKVSSQINCMHCANCCKSLNPSLIEKNFQDFTKVLNEEEMSDLQDHLYYDKANQRWIVKTSPCPLLKDNLCKVYEYRPHSCSEYPHIDPAEFKFKKLSVINNYGICPIVYNTVEQLKQRLGFNSSKEN